MCVSELLLKKRSSEDYSFTSGFSELIYNCCDSEGNSLWSLFFSINLSKFLLLNKNKNIKQKYCIYVCMYVYLHKVMKGPGSSTPPSHNALIKKFTIHINM